MNFFFFHSQKKKLRWLFLLNILIDHLIMIENNRHKTDNVQNVDMVRLTDIALACPLKALQVHWVSASESATRGLWTEFILADWAEFLSKSWPPELDNGAILSTVVATLISLSLTKGTWQVMVLTMVWIWWSRPIMLAWSCNVSRIQRRSQVPSQVLSQVHSQGFPWRERPPEKCKQHLLLCSCFIYSEYILVLSTHPYLVYVHISFLMLFK